MDFDIDAVLDQLEKTLNQSDHEDKITEQIIQTPSSSSTLTKSVDDLLLLDLDPLGNPENNDNNDNNQENDDKLERIKQDLQELYASSVVVDTPSVPIPILPDLIGQQDELSSTPLPLVVEQLEFEVRQEVLQHTLEQASSLLSPDITNISNSHHDDEKETTTFSTSSISDDEEHPQRELEENLTSSPDNEATKRSTSFAFQNEPDLIQHETFSTQAQFVLHSVDSIVNAPMGSNLDDFIVSSSPMSEIMPLQLTSDVFFTSCDDSEEKSMQLPSEDLIVESSLLSSPSNNVTNTATTQDFDLVKNVLSEMFDKNNEEILDENPIEEKESELVNIEQHDISSSTIFSPSLLNTNNDDDDFRFLDDMLASIDGHDTDIHQLTSAEIDRVDSLLKDIVNSHQREAAVSSAAEIPPNDIEPCPPPSPPLSEQASISPNEFSGLQIAQSVAASVSAVPVDEELIRVEQEWAKLTEAEKTLGSVAPEWVSDDQAPICTKCAAKFSITRRRHHCRACGKVFCSTCCWQKVKLIYGDSKEDRACNDCIKTINHVEYLWNYKRNNQKPRSSVLRKKTGKN
ncbi:unnamed protein product [Rotaria magnacalcarata]|uniref:FYVE-type domain-containing protein n=1 Tax=Rotaria magnacalcarata TaxID=392030 RepID=A0A819CY23_9BILA|nr:unnamed protein product [Rotaria magnacalcarata]CAF3828743.1 unnamed protein product [Rotaria magnacalcarata]